MKTGGSEIKVFPNPASNHIVISSTVQVSGYEIRNMIGQLVKKDDFTDNKIPLEDLQNGMYILKLFSGDNQPVVKQFLKAK